MAKTTQIIRGLEIIEKYEPDTDVSTDWYCIYAGCQDIQFKMTDEEFKVMHLNGWFIDELNGCWCIVLD